MKKVYKNKIVQQVFAFGLILSMFGCQWVLTHPKEDAAIINEGEAVIGQIYQYETGQPLMPGPINPPAATTQPPMQ